MEQIWALETRPPFFGKVPKDLDWGTFCFKSFQKILKTLEPLGSPFKAFSEMFRNTWTGIPPSSNLFGPIIQNTWSRRPFRKSSKTLQTGDLPVQAFSDQLLSTWTRIPPSSSDKIQSTWTQRPPCSSLFGKVSKDLDWETSWFKPFQNTWQNTWTRRPPGSSLFGHFPKHLTKHLNQETSWLMASRTNPKHLNPVQVF